MAVNLKDLIDLDLLAYFKSKLDLLFAGKVDKENGKGLSSNDYTSEEKTKLAGIAAGAQVNTLEGIQVAGTTINPVNKIANIPVATTSAPGAMSAADKTKLDGVAAGAQVNIIETVKVNGTALTPSSKAVDVAVPVPATAAPLMDGTAAVGSSAKFAKEDHVHPSDTTKVDKVTGKGLSTNDFTNELLSKLTNLPDIVLVPNDIGTKVLFVSDEDRSGTTYLAIDFSSDPNNQIAQNVTSFMMGLLTGFNYWFIGNDSPFTGLRFYIVETVNNEFTQTTYLTFAALDKLNSKIYWSRMFVESNTKIVGELYEIALTSNDFTNAYKTKLDGIEAGAQVNVVTNASSTGSGASETMTVIKGSTNYTTYTKNALDTSLGLKADASSVYTKTEIDQKLVGTMNYKGTKATTSALPSSGNAQGDVWHITADGSEWAWNGSAWEELGVALDLSGYVEDDDLGLATTEDIDALFS